MGVHRILLLKQWPTKPTLQSLTALSQLPTRPYTQLSDCTAVKPDNNKNSTLCSKVVKFVTDSPDSYVVPLLGQYVKEGNTITDKDLQNIIHTLRHKKHLHRALEVSEWMTCKSTSHLVSDDLALQLNLIWKVHGIDAAERFFIEADDHSERIHIALLNCYVNENLLDKSLSHFEKMKDMGLATDPFTYNSIMSLYMNTGQVEKIPDMLLEMEDNSVSPNEVSYRMCLKSYALRSDFTSMEKLLKIMESHPHITMDWFTYCTVANYYLGGRHNEKAIYCLRRAETRVHDNAVGYNNLITMYSKLGDVTQVIRLWQKHKASCKEQSNADYMVMIGSLVKLGEPKEAERLLQEWESGCSSYDFRVPEVLLMGYVHRGQILEAERLLAGIISKRGALVPNTWTIMSAGYINLQNMEKALECMKFALELGPQYQGWQPKKEVTSSILDWLGDKGDIGEVDEFIKLMSKVVPMNKKMYQTLLKANIRHGQEIDDILQKMKADSIDVDVETSLLIKSKIGC